MDTKRSSVETIRATSSERDKGSIVRRGLAILPRNIKSRRFALTWYISEGTFKYVIVVHGTRILDEGRRRVAKMSSYQWNSGINEATREIAKQPSNIVRSLLMANDVQPAVLDLNKVIDIERFSSLRKLLRVTCYVLRFVNALKTKKLDKQTVAKRSEHLTSSEARQAELLWIRSLQGQSFSNEISFISSGKEKSTTPVYVKQFGLFLDDDHILRCKGRINNASLNLGSKNPILLSSKSRFVELFIYETHDNIKHSGIPDTLTTIRERFWLIRGRETVKRIIKKCVICRKAEGLPYGATTPPPLPACRVLSEPPFVNVGLDFAGPLFDHEKHGGEKESEKSKVYVLLFTCASTRAVHLELTPSLSVPAFLRAFRRYAS